MSTPEYKKLPKKEHERVIMELHNYQKGEKASGSGLGYCDLLSSIKKLAVANQRCRFQLVIVTSFMKS